MNSNPYLAPTQFNSPFSTGPQQPQQNPPGASPYSFPNIFPEQQQTQSSKQPLSLDQQARSSFIAKVYMLLTLQLLCTVLVGIWAMNSNNFKTIFLNVPMIIILSVSIVAIGIVLSCCVETFRKYALPLFVLFTLVFALLVGVTICGYKSTVVLLAAGLTLLVVIALTAYAWFTKSDFTGCGPYLLVLSVVMLGFGIACIFITSPILQLIYSALATIMFSIYLIYDTQMVVGKQDRAFSLDDAYLAALHLYMDVVQLFLQILRLVSAFQN